ncbi:membrane protein insertion efficiency factor YidD [Myxococcota bacterium]|nr:membrane protein insertion efficiency factor YidD [Myxococcota bacterium]
MSATLSFEPTEKSHKTTTGALRGLIVAILRVYQMLISPLLGPSCRFSPTCSEYAVEAVTRHGALRGGWLTARRLLRCQPFGRHGCDPVP